MHRIIRCLKDINLVDAFVAYERYRKSNGSITDERIKSFTLNGADLLGIGDTVRNVAWVQDNGSCNDRTGKTTASCLVNADGGN